MVPMSSLLADVLYIYCIYVRYKIVHFRLYCAIINGLHIWLCWVLVDDTALLNKKKLP